MVPNGKRNLGPAMVRHPRSSARQSWQFGHRLSRLLGRPARHSGPVGESAGTSMNLEQSPATGTTPPASSPRPPVAALLFCAALMFVGVVFLGIFAWRYLHPPEDEPARDIAAEAKQFIRESKPAPLSEPLA